MAYFTFTGSTTVSLSGSQTYTITPASRVTLCGVKLVASSDLYQMEKIATCSWNNTTNVVTIAFTGTVTSKTTFRLYATGHREGVDVEEYYDIEYTNYPVVRIDDYKSQVLQYGSTINIPCYGKSTYPSISYSVPANSTLRLSGISFSTTGTGNSGYYRTLKATGVSGSGNLIVTATVGSTSVSKTINITVPEVSELHFSYDMYSPTTTVRYNTPQGRVMDNTTMVIAQSAGTFNIYPHIPNPTTTTGNINLIDYSITGDVGITYLSSSTSSGIATFRYTTNSTGANKTGYINATYNYNGTTTYTRSITVVQLGYDIVLSNALFDKDGGTKNLTTTGMSTPTFSGSGFPSWLSISSNGVLTASSNGSYVPRKVTVGITASWRVSEQPVSFTKYFDVTQANAPSIYVTPSSKTVTYEEGSYEPKYTVVGAGTAIGAAPLNSSWVTANAKYVTYTANSSSQSRQTSIRYYNANAYGLVGHTNTYISLTQNGYVPASSILLSPETNNTTYQGGEILFQVTTTFIDDASLAVSISGSVSYSTYSLDYVSTSGDLKTYILRIQANQNNSSSIQSSTVTVTGSYGGNTYSDSSTLTKEANAGSISISPASESVTSAAGSVTFTVNSQYLNNVTASASGDMVTSQSFNSSTGVLTVNYSANVSGASRTASITASGVNGNNVVQTATATLTQVSLTPTITLSPDSRTLTSTEKYAQFFVNYTTGLALDWTKSDQYSIIDVSNSGFITDSGNTYLRICTYDNTSSQEKLATVKVTGTLSGISTVYESNTVTIHKQGAPGSISVTPETKTVGYSSGSTTFDVSMTNITSSTVGVVVLDDTMNITSATLNSAKTQLTVTYAANTGFTKLYATISVYGQDGYRTTQNDTVTITQNPQMKIEISPSTKTISNSDSLAEFSVNYSEGLKDYLVVHTSGNVIVNDSGLYNAGTTSATFRLYPAANNTNSNRTETIYFTAVYGGTTYTSNSVTLTQNGLPGSISLSPSTASVSAASGTATFDVTSISMTSSTITASAAAGSTMNITSVTLNSAKTKVTVAYTENTSTDSTKTGTITVSGSDYLGNTQTATATITQAVRGLITFSPSDRTVAMAAGSTTFTLALSNIASNAVNVSYNGAMINTVSYNSSTRVITISYSVNATGNTRSATITASGTDNGGCQISSTANIVQNGGQVYVTVTPDSRTLSATEPYAQFFVSFTEGMTLSYTMSGNISVNASTTGFYDTTSTSAYFRVYPAPNTETAQKTSTFTITGTLGTTTINGNAVTVVQQGVPGGIVVTPASKDVTSAAGSAEFDLTLSNMNTTTLNAVVVSSTMNNVSPTINANRTKLVVAYGANTGQTDLTATVSVYGQDVWGITQNYIVTLNQSGQGSITITPSTVNVPMAAGEVNLQLTLVNVNESTLSISNSGGLITNTSYNPASKQITVSYSANGTGSPRNSSVTVTANSIGGEPLTATANVTQSGSALFITVAPDAKMMLQEDEYCEFDVSFTEGLEMSYTSSGSMEVLATTGFYNSTATTAKFRVYASPNTTSANKVSTFTIAGSYGGNNTTSNTFTVTQVGIPGTMSITPESHTFDAIGGQFIFTLNTTGVVRDTLSVAFSETEMPISSINFRGTYLEVICGQAISTKQTSSIVTVTGRDGNGIESSATCTVYQNGAQPVLTAIIEPNLISANGGVASINAVSNIVNPIISLSSDQPWVTVNGTSLVVAQNTTENRTAVITVTATDPTDGTITVSTTVELRQNSGRDALSPYPATHTFDETGGSFTFEITQNNMDVSSITSSVLSNDIHNLKYSLNSSKTGLTVVVGGWDITTDDRQRSGRSAIIRISGYTNLGDFVYTDVFVTQSSTHPFISAEKDMYIISSEAGTLPISITFGNLSRTPSCSWSGDINIQMPVEIAGNTWIFNYGENTTDSVLHSVVYFSVGYGDQVPVSCKVDLYQLPASSDLLPIWRETSINQPTPAGLNYVDYSVLDYDKVIYTGRAYAYPGETTIDIQLNDTIANYLGNGIIFEEGVQEIPEYLKMFNVVSSDGLSASYTVYNSWSYQDTDYWLSDPIDTRVSCKQWLPVSFINIDNSFVTINDVVYAGNEVNKAYTAMARLSNVSTPTFTVSGGDGTSRTYTITDGEYVLYYCNKWGGWDSILLNATSKKTDTVETYSYRRKAGYGDFNKVDYQKYITPTWNLKTKIFFGNEGKKMDNLLESTMLYLHNLITDEIIPVVITNSSCDYLNYTNNKRQPYSYEITVEESYGKIRK